MPQKFVTQSQIERHNRTVEKMISKSFKNFNSNHSDILTEAPKGYYFTITNKLAKKMVQYSH